MSSDSRSRAIALAEVVAVATVGSAVRAGMRALGAGIAAGSLSIVVVLALATWLLRRRGLSWRELGLRRPPDFGAMAGWTLALLLVDAILVPQLTAFVGHSLGWPPQHLEAFAELRGNLARYLVLLIPVSWGSAALGEELLFRGFLARRMADALGGTPGAELSANFAQAALFALAHAYLGPRGMLSAGALGLAAGFVWRSGGRNLWPLVIAHGLVDTVGITVLYLGVPHS
jgi:membrane protease YdiL (CAAX protease family)